MATTPAEGLADAGRLRERWQFAAARDALTSLLADPSAQSDRLAMVSGRRMLAEVLRDLGEADEAYAVARPLAVECEERFGAVHPATVRALTVLATVVHARGDLADASELYERVLDGRCREQGPAGRAIRLARAHLALLHRDSAADNGASSGADSAADSGVDSGVDNGAAARARAELDAAYKGLRRAYGITDPDTIRFGLELARMYRQAGDDAVARRLLTVARAGCQAGLEPWHPLVTLVRRELAELEPADAPAPKRAPLSPAGDLAGPPPGAEGRIPAPPPPPVATSDAGDGLPVAVKRHHPALERRHPAVKKPHPAAVWRHPVAVWRYLPAHLGVDDRWRRARRPVLILIAATLAVIVAVAVTAAVATGAHHRGEPRRPAARPAPAPPTATGHERLRVQLRDEGATLVASWPDPADGPVPVVVAVARDGKDPTVVAKLPAGTREYTLTAMDPQAEYCVIVGAVYPGETAADTTTTCTRRVPGR
ncbi:MAG TPA: tetratricopeptide repeat protein [Planosporangium sp.]|nr:tetratricopeptide repeat protein [Planosporangium sp.]